MRPVSAVWKISRFLGRDVLSIKEGCLAMSIHPHYTQPSCRKDLFQDSLALCPRPSFTRTSLRSPLLPFWWDFLLFLRSYWRFPPLLGLPAMAFSVFGPLLVPVSASFLKMIFLPFLGLFVLLDLGNEYYWFGRFFVFLDFPETFLYGPFLGISNPIFVALR